MANADIFTVLYSKKLSPLDFKWDTMIAPPLLSLISPQDIYAINQIARSNKLASKPDEKYKMIANILNPRGFKKIASGTNRVVYKYLEDQSICLKIAFDRVGLKDNPQEYQNQFMLKPFVTRIFEVSPCGTVALVERVEPIVSREEYLHIADDIFNLLVEKIIGKYVVDDIGTNFFQNIGLRVGFGPVLLDFPYVYELDGAKLHCNWQHPETHEYCLGEIDYDDGFNYLVCTKCGKRYQARQLAKQVKERSIIVERKGVTQAMEIQLMRGDEVVEVIRTEEESKTTMPVKKEHTSGVKVLNMKNFEARKKNAEIKEENRKKAVEEARERRDKKVSNNINNSLDNLNKPSGETKKKEQKIETVDAAEIAENVNPNYIEAGRFPRAKPTEQGESIQNMSVDEFVKKTIPDAEIDISDQIEVDDVDESITEETYTEEEVTESNEEIEEDSNMEESIEDEVQNAIKTGEELIDSSVEEESEIDEEVVPVVETTVGLDDNDLSDQDVKYPTKEELDASSWENPVRVTDIIFDLDDDVSGMY